MFNQIYTEPNMSKNNNFTILRMICCFIVIYEHYVCLRGLSWLNLNLRGSAVNIFFILSGFWVTFSLFRSKSLKEYFLKRYKKIFPLYWGVVIFSALFLSFASTLSLSEYFTNIHLYKYLIANLSTLNFIHPNLPGVFEGLPLNGAVNGALWTIKIEVGFYILLPIILFFISKISIIDNNRRAWSCIIIFVIIYMLSAIYVFIIPSIANKFSLPSSLANQLPAYMSYFIIGMTWFFFFDKLEKLLNKLIFVALPIFILLLIIRNIYLSAFFEPMLLSIIIMWFSLKVKFLFKFSKIHDYSYVLYLIHYPIIMLMEEFL